MKKLRGKGIAAIGVGAIRRVVKKRIRRKMKARTGSSCNGPVRRARITPTIVMTSQIRRK